MADISPDPNQYHPLPLRPGGNSPSTSPPQQHQAQYQNAPQHQYAAQTQRATPPQPAYSVDAEPVFNYEFAPNDDVNMQSSYARHPSGNTPSSSIFSSPPPPSQSPPLQSMNAYGTGPSPGPGNSNSNGRFPSQNYPPQSPSDTGATVGNPFVEHGPRSRSSTAGQPYPLAGAGGVGAPPMPVSPPQQVAPPLFAQHSGAPTPAGSSRPVSRGTAMSAMHTGGSASGGGGRPASNRSPFSTPITSPPRQRPHQILLINPNSTRAMTDACLQSIRATLPPGIEVTGYTAPYPAPTAIESATDAIMSTEAVLRDLAKFASGSETVQNFDGMIVACFSRHPLIDALRESYDVPIIGIMEAGLYVARMLGGRFGIVATAHRAKIMQDDAVAAYGLTHFYVGSEATHLGVLELDTRPKEDVAKRIMHASRSLVVKGADTVVLGCAGMTDMVRAAKDGVRDEDGRRTVNVIDPVEAGVMMMASLIGMGIPTSKKGLFKGEREARRTRGQNWL